MNFVVEVQQLRAELTTLDKLVSQMEQRAGLRRIERGQRAWSKMERRQVSERMKKLWAGVKAGDAGR